MVRCPILLDPFATSVKVTSISKLLRVRISDTCSLIGYLLPSLKLLQLPLLVATAAGKMRRLAYPGIHTT